MLKMRSQVPESHIWFSGYARCVRTLENFKLKQLRSTHKPVTSLQFINVDFIGQRSKPFAHPFVWNCRTIHQIFTVQGGCACVAL